VEQKTIRLGDDSIKDSGYEKATNLERNAVVCFLPYHRKTPMNMKVKRIIYEFFHIKFCDVISAGLDYKGKRRNGATRIVSAQRARKHFFKEDLLA
jgi:hypothetical protein